MEHEYDFERALLLLSVAEKSLGYPKLKAIHDGAVAELEAMLPQPEPVEEPVADHVAEEGDEEEAGEDHE
jgi:hypothetical protein